MKTKMTVVAGLAAVGLLAGCATPHVVDINQSGDAGLSCAQIKTELAVAEDYMKAAKKERTVTGTNVAAAVLFWPALLGTYVNTEEAMTAAKERQAVLNKLAEKKRCNLGAEAASAEPARAVPAQSVVNQAPAQAPVQGTVQVPSASPSKPMTTMEAQTRLLARGLDAGVADGAMGKKTVAALRKFQKDNNLPVTGKVDVATAERLRQN